MKPHLYMMGGRWHCTGLRLDASVVCVSGIDPLTAYLAWQRWPN